MKSARDRDWCCMRVSLRSTHARKGVRTRTVSVGRGDARELFLLSSTRAPHLECLQG